jgi:periplasmic protein CpxP/Spy
MNKTRFLTGAVVALLLLNISVIAFFLSQRRPRPMEGPRQIMIEKLHFDTAQIAAYDQLIEQHRNKIRTKETEITNAKSQLYLILQGEDRSQMDMLIRNIGQLQEAVERIHFEHFSGIKSICKGSQIADFNNLAVDLSMYFSPKKKKH